MRDSALMRLVVLGLNCIASPQSLIDIWMPQFIMISNEKIIHWRYPIVKSICEVRSTIHAMVPMGAERARRHVMINIHDMLHIYRRVDTVVLQFNY